ncbi:MAG: sugar ABC transporter substrate-binding protein [Deltaproteobacteria bacterium HGW-Deltaproteobacteria-23]|nr:MAG: sugar ABC transporter substrate-binding protein [Deltaproteobacteria bacterium HGW-Deltaproteobacteria-23]
MAIKNLLCLLALLLLTVLLPINVSAGDYIIGEGDTLAISVWGVDRLNFPVKVRPDGKITVPGLGDVKASGFTPRDLQKELTIRLKDLVKNPIVTVTVSEITNSKVYIFGSGIKSGIFEVVRKTSLLQILCSLQDLKSADLRRAYLMRNGKKIKEDFHNLFINGDINEDLTVEANDAIFIPLMLDKNIYALGELNTPKAIEFREGITVMDVILEAGGFTKFASQNDITIIRKDGDKETKIKVNVKKLIKKADLSQNVRLRPGDYIVIEESLF